MQALQARQNWHRFVQHNISFLPCILQFSVFWYPREYVFACIYIVAVLFYVQEKSHWWSCSVSAYTLSQRGRRGIHHLPRSVFLVFQKEKDQRFTYHYNRHTWLYWHKFIHKHFWRGCKSKPIWHLLGRKRQRTYCGDLKRHKEPGIFCVKSDNSR